MSKNWFAAAIAIFMCAPALATDDDHGHGHGSHERAYTVAASCHDGVAGDHACSRINLISFMSTTRFNSGSLSDVWGWVDPQSGDEYVIVGHFNGTSFVRITWPDMPELVGFLPAHEDLVATGVAYTGSSKSCSAGRAKGSDGLAHDDEGCSDEEGSNWRDIKVHANHAFVVSEASGHGLQIFDLTRLRTGTPTTIYDEDAHVSTFGNAHNIALNEQTGIAYVVGAGPFGGGLMFFDVSDPQQTQALGGYAGDGYTHDVQCVVYAGPDTQYTGREICFASNEDTVTIVDVTDKANPVQIARRGYSNVQYVHQGWLSLDQRYFYQNDELDEQRGLAQTRTLIWDMSDLRNPTLVKEHMGVTRSIDHNNYTHGEYLFQSNYTTGLRVLSTKDPVELLEVAHFDTFPANDGATFNGTWSNYPYFPSGVIAVSDKNEGLYILDPAFMQSDLPNGDLAVSVSTATEQSTGAQQSTFRYSATVTNASGVDLEDVQLTHILPGSAVPSLVESAATCARRDQFLDCNVGTLTAGTDVSFTIAVQVPAASRANYEVRASAMNADPNHGNNKASGSIILSSPPPAATATRSGGGGALGVIGLLLLGAFGSYRGWFQSMAVGMPAQNKLLAAVHEPNRELRVW